MGTPIFGVKRTSNSQDTVDYIVQRAARKNSSGNPGLNREIKFFTLQVVTLSMILLDSLSRSGGLLEAKFCY